MYTWRGQIFDSDSDKDQKCKFFWVKGQYWYRFLIKGYKDIFLDKIVFWQKFLNEKMEI